MTFAIIDAAAQRESRACGCAVRSRYLTPIANLPLIYHVFDELAAAGIDRVQVIVRPRRPRGARARSGRRRARGGWRSPTRPYPSTTAASAALAEVERTVADEPVLVYPGDCLFPGRVSAMWERFRVGNVDAVVLSSGNGAERSRRLALAQRSSRVFSAPAIVGSPAAPVIDELRSGGVDHRDLADWSPLERLPSRGMRARRPLALQR